MALALEADHFRTKPNKSPPSGPLWVHEIKHDGYRLMVRRGGLRVRCFTRNGHDWWRANSEEHCQRKFPSAARQRMAFVSGIFPSPYLQLV